MNKPDAIGTLWQITAPHLSPTRIRAENWLQALGNLLSCTRSAPIGRLGCERLRNGDVIAHDLTNGHRYIIQPHTVLIQLTEADLEPLDEADAETEEVLRPAITHALSG